MHETTTVRNFKGGSCKCEAKLSEAVAFTGLLVWGSNSVGNNWTKIPDTDVLSERPYPTISAPLRRHRESNLFLHISVKKNLVVGLKGKVASSEEIGSYFQLKSTGSKNILCNLAALGGALK